MSPLSMPIPFEASIIFHIITFGTTHWHAGTPVHHHNFKTKLLHTKCAPFFFQSRAGSYFYYPRLTKRHPAAAASATGASKHSQHLPPKNSSSFRSSFDGSPISSAALTARPPSAQSEEMKRAITLRRVSSLKNTSDDIEVSKGVFDQFA